MLKHLRCAAFWCATLALTPGCDKKPDQVTSNKPVPENADSGSEKKATPDDQGPVSQIAFLDLYGSLGSRGLEVPEMAGWSRAERLAAMKKAAGDTRKSIGDPLPFTRLVGGEGFYCGTLKNGPVRCWGAKDDYIPGGFVDVAIAGREICAVEASGSVQCADGRAPQLTAIKRIAGSGTHFCALSGSGKVNCWATGGAALEPPPGLKARFLAVAANFACAANDARELECWGPGVPKDAPLKSSIGDLASTGLGMCLLDPEGKIRCFGAPLDAGSESYTAINGGFGTICGKRKDKDLTECKGRVAKNYEKPSQRVAVATKTVCALQPDGSPDCIGLNFGSEISFPRAKAPEPLKDKDPLFDEFLALFPKGNLPFDMTRKATFDLGPQVPDKFYNFLDGHPGTFRVVAQFDTLARSVVVFDWHFGGLELYTYDDFGNIVRHRSIANIGPGWHGRDAMVLADGSEIDEQSYHSKESVLLPGGKLETTSYDRHEILHYAPLKKGESSKKISHIECVIGGVKSVDQILESGLITRDSAKRLPSHAETDEDGCGDRWPTSRPSIPATAKR